MSTETNTEKSAQITPSIGRVVWYTPGESDLLPGNVKGQPYPALITHVWDDSIVNLAVQNDGHFPIRAECLNPTSVALVPNDAKIVSGRCWQWMPFQKGQAAKTEAVSGNVSKAVALVAEYARKVACGVACDHAAVQAEVNRLLGDTAMFVVPIEATRPLPPIEPGPAIVPDPVENQG